MPLYIPPWRWPCRGRNIYEEHEWQMSFYYWLCKLLCQILYKQYTDIIYRMFISRKNVMVSLLKDLNMEWFRAIRTCCFGTDTVGQSLFVIECFSAQSLTGVNYLKKGTEFEYSFNVIWDTRFNKNTNMWKTCSLQPLKARMLKLLGGSTYSSMKRNLAFHPFLVQLMHFYSLLKQD